MSKKREAGVLHSPSHGKEYTKGAKERIMIREYLSGNHLKINECILLNSGFWIRAVLISGSSKTIL